MNEDSPRSNWLARRAAVLCAAVLLLLPALYLGSYSLLLDRGTSLPDSFDPFIIIPPEPKPCIREQYVVGGEGVRWFFRPANRLHRILDRAWSTAEENL